MSRLRANFATGTLTAQLLTAGTSITSPELASLPVISDPDYMPVALDPFGEFGAPEIVWITDHASGATVATILRHQEGTLARQHDVPTVWANTLTAKDFDDLYAAVDGVEGALPSYLPLAGGEMVGPLLLGGDPLDPAEAATKQYVDQSIGEGDFLPIAGGTLTGFLSLHANPTATSHAVNKAYCDLKALSGHTHSGYAPTSHSHSYAGVNHNHDGDYANPHSHPYAPTSHAHSAYMPIAGGNFTGNVTGSQEATFNERIKSNAGIVGETIWATDPLTTSNNGLPGWRHNTSQGSAGWEFMRLLSSIRYKQSIEPVVVPELISQLRAAGKRLISWQDLDSAADSPRYIGISAEDAYEIVPDAVALDEEGRPESVEPINAFGVHLIAAVADLLDRVEVLEGI